VGTVEECKKRCHSYDKALLFTTLAEVSDVANMEETLATRAEHETVVHEICDLLKEAKIPHHALSSDSCAICDSCAWPKEPCRHPDQMLPCLESYGLLVTSAAEKLDMEFFYDSQTVVWYGLILFSEN
jgi:predicted metal-binding protein